MSKWQWQDILVRERITLGRQNEQDDAWQERHEKASWSHEQLRHWQWSRLVGLTTFLQGHSPFYSARWDRGRTGLPSPLRTWEDWESLPFLTKNDIENPDDPMGLAKHHTYSVHAYARCHRTSGTMGRPTTILDTREDWEWWLATWQYVLDAASVEATDRVLFAFSFGPFIGFWSAFEACADRRALVIPTGGMASLARLETIREMRPTIVCCTPSYALHLGALAEERGIDLQSLGVRHLLVAGEPGGSVMAVRKQLHATWNATVIDHAGATEIGPWGYGEETGTGLFIIESEFYPEFLPTEQMDGEEPLFELVLTSLHRYGCPVVRYRTGDLVRKPVRNATGFVYLPGGVVGRADEMVVVRGVNFFPSSLEAVMRSLPEVREYQVILTQRQALDEMLLRVEAPPDLAQPIAQRIQVQLGLRVAVECVPVGEIVAHAGKSRRIQDRRPH